MESKTTEIVLQIATPFSTGTGFYLADYDLVITNEHVVRDNATVLVTCPSMERCLLQVVYLDAYYDLAFLRPNQPMALPAVPLAKEPLQVAATVRAMGQQYGQRLQIAEGQIIATEYKYEGLGFLQHTARLASAQSGGPLFNEAGELVGVNMYDIDEGHHLALSLPVNILVDCLTEYQTAQGRSATRCFDCHALNIEPLNGQQRHCRSCGAPITLPRDVADFQPSGIQATVEDILQQCGHDPQLARRGPNHWEISQGSARIQVTYHEDSGLVTGDAHLCELPDASSAALFEYLLQQNYALDQLTLSTRGRNAILSLLIYDRYLEPNAGKKQFEHLFAMADYYDNILVEKFGATWL